MVRPATVAHPLEDVGEAGASTRSASRSSRPRRDRTVPAPAWRPVPPQLGILVRAEAAEPLGSRKRSSAASASRRVTAGRGPSLADRLQPVLPRPAVEVIARLGVDVAPARGGYPRAPRACPHPWVVARGCPRRRTSGPRRVGPPRRGGRAAGAGSGRSRPSGAVGDRPPGCCELLLGQAEVRCRVDGLDLAALETTPPRRRRRQTTSARRRAPAHRGSGERIAVGVGARRHRGVAEADARWRGRQQREVQLLPVVAPPVEGRAALNESPSRPGTKCGPLVGEEPPSSHVLVKPDATTT